MHTRLLLIRRSFCCMAWLAAGISTCAAAAAEYDLVIANGHIIDGTGSPWYGGDVAVKEGRIAAIGNLSSASRKKTIDAHGLIVGIGKHYCRKSQPHCDGCPLQPFLPRSK